MREVKQLVDSLIERIVMTSKLEKQFFDTFDIQYEFCSDICLNPCKFQCNDCEFRTERYPQITDSILLELICILATYLKNIECCHLVIADNIETLKRHTLNDCMDYVKDIKHQVRTLFGEG